MVVAKFGQFLLVLDALPSWPCHRVPFNMLQRARVFFSIKQQSRKGRPHSKRQFLN